MALCILCKIEEASTSEHIFKADRYRQLLGNRPSLYIVDGSETKKNIKSAKNKLLTPKKNLCGKCNSHRSQQPDKIFSDLDRYLHEEIEKQVKMGNKEIFISAEPFFQDRDTLDYLHLVRYFAKFFACQLNRSDYAIPNILTKIFMTGEGFRQLKVTITGDGGFIDRPMMRNGGLGYLLNGVAGDVTVKLAKIGVLPEEIHTNIQHGPIIYNLTLKIPESETVESARFILDKNINEAFESIGIPAEERTLISNAPLMKKAEITHTVAVRHIETSLKNQGVPVGIFRILTKFFMLVYKIKNAASRTKGILIGLIKNRKKDPSINPHSEG